MRPPRDLIQLAPEGLYCPLGDFYIDPWRPVARAVITHGHGDHGRTGMGEYYCTAACLPILQWRLGTQTYHVYDYNQSFQLGACKVSFHSAGHVLGSAQVRIEHNDEVWVASGDYKRQHDPTCSPFEVVQCDTFITETTFGLPIYKWPPTPDVAKKIVAWRDACAERGEAAILYAYALGKAQRILAELMPFTQDTVYLHGAIATGVNVYRNAGIALIDTQPIGELSKTENFAGKLILAPPSAAGSSWTRRFKKAQQGFASGWMCIRGNRRRRNYDRGFVVSDHADWQDLLNTIEATQASRIIATHGDTHALVRYLQEHGKTAQSFTTQYDEDD
jgi:putative mRNA 3-end processing factor